MRSKAAGETVVRRNARRAVWTAVALAGLFVAGTYLPPLMAEARPLAASWIRDAYAPLCHQLPERSLTVAAGTQAVCARCAGLYWGGWLGLALGGAWFAGTARRPRPVHLALAVAPTAADALLPWLGFAGLSNLPRMLLAAPAGLMGGIFLALGIAGLFPDAANESSTREPTAPVGIGVPEETDG